MMRFLAWISAIGLVLSIVCHILGWLRVDPPGGQAVMFLHLGIFIVGFPLAFFANRTKPQKSGRGNLGHLLARLPNWAGMAVGLVPAYALLNFVHSMLLASQYPKHQVPFWLVLRGFSGIWMMFYGVALDGFIGLARLGDKRSQSSIGGSNQGVDE